MTPFEADLHIHTRHSSDGHMEPEEVLAEARQAGLCAIAVTDHNTLRGAREVRRAAAGSDVLVVVGMEVSSFNGHILALGVSEPIPKGLSANETIQRINDQDGVAIAAHPGRFYTGLSIHDVRAASFRAVEVANGHSSFRQNALARKLARGMKVAMVGGSDAHWYGEVGACRTVLPRRPDSERELLDMIRRCETDAVGEGLGRADSLRLQSGMLGRWLRRGGRRM